MNVALLRARRILYCRNEFVDANELVSTYTPCTGQKRVVGFIKARQQGGGVAPLPPALDYPRVRFWDRTTAMITRPIGAAYPWPEGYSIAGDPSQLPDVVYAFNMIIEGWAVSVEYMQGDNAGARIDAMVTLLPA